jgi:hypothetical protein
MNPQTPMGTMLLCTPFRFVPVLEVEMNVLPAPLSPSRPPGDAAELRLHRFPQVPEPIPPQKNRSASFVSRDLLANKEERPFVVPFERFPISLRKEHPR